jgi:DNA-binding MarR family transcriptional regulator
MSDPRRRTVVLRTRPQIDAITSPLRQEVVVQLGRGASPVKALAARLGRSPHSLYPHVRRLVAAGIVRVAETRRAGKRDEAWYALVGHRIQVGARDAGPAARAARERTIAALLRMTAREVGAALARKSLRLEGEDRQVQAFRVVRRLTAEQLRRLNRRIESLARGLAKTPPSAPSGPGTPTFAVTIVVTPTRDSR